VATLLSRDVTPDFDGGGFADSDSDGDDTDWSIRSDRAEEGTEDVSPDDSMDHGRDADSLQSVSVVDDDQCVEVGAPEQPVESTSNATPTMELEGAAVGGLSRRSTRLVEQESRDMGRTVYYHSFTHPVHEHDPGLLPSD
jgi:hypothetical protein